MKPSEIRAARLRARTEKPRRVAAINRKLRALAAELYAEAVAEGITGEDAVYAFVKAKRPNDMRTPGFAKRLARDAEILAARSKMKAR